MGGSDQDGMCEEILEESAGGTVRWIIFIDPSTLPKCSWNVPIGSDAIMNGRFELQDGEYIRLVRGRRVESADDCLAEWVVIWTSQPRKLTIGRPQLNPVPTFSFLAAP